MLLRAKKLKDAVECPPAEILLCTNAAHTPGEVGGKGGEPMAVQGGFAEWRTRR